LVHEPLILDALLHLSTLTSQSNANP